MSSESFDWDKINRDYSERGFFARFIDMCRGLRAAPETRVYKEARIELQRQSAPIAAIVTVLLVVVSLIVMTAVEANREKAIQVTVAPIEPDEPDPDEPDEPDEPEPQEMTDVVDAVDLPSMSSEIPTETQMAPSPNPGGDPNTVLNSISPVSMTGVSGSNRPHGLGPGDGGGFGTQIKGNGSGNGYKDCLIGVIVDLKRDGEGKSRSLNYWRDVQSLVDGNFSAKAMGEFFVLPRKVALTHMFIPTQPAENGPKAFGVDDLMKPMGWVAYYTGKIVPGRKMRCRFIGYFDDLLLIRVNGNVVLDCSWMNHAGAKGEVTGWESPERKEAGKWGTDHPDAPRAGSYFAFGDWFDADPQQPIQLDLVIGERPGGQIGGAVMIEEEGVEYEKEQGTGRPIWPIFASRPLGLKSKEKLEDFNKYAIGTDSPPFNAPKRKKVDFSKSNVSVEVDI